jgi:hypothetical protein
MTFMVGEYMVRRTKDIEKLLQEREEPRRGDR